MTIAVACPGCGRPGPVPEGCVGKRIRCQDCRAKFTLAPDAGSAAGGLVAVLLVPDPVEGAGAPPGPAPFHPGLPTRDTVHDLRPDCHTRPLP